MTLHRHMKGLPSLLPFDVTDYLQTTDDIDCSLKTVLEDGTALEIVAMINDICRASVRLLVSG